VDGKFRLTNTTKTVSSRRLVPLGDEALIPLKLESVRRAAERLRAGTAWHDYGLVFASPIGTPRDMRNTQREWHAFLEAAGVERRPFHTIRHSAATYLLTGGMSMEVVSGVLGHSSLAVTAGAYAQVTDRLKAPAAAAMDAAIRKDRASS
jgi:integrase